MQCLLQTYTDFCSGSDSAGCHHAVSVRFSLSVATICLNRRREDFNQMYVAALISFIGDQGCRSGLI